jgi:hypothetical protein
VTDPLDIPDFLRREPTGRDPMRGYDPGTSRPPVVMPRDGQANFLVPKSVEPAGLALMREIENRKTEQRDQRLSLLKAHSKRDREARAHIKQEIDMSKMKQIVEEYNALAAELGKKPVQKFENVVAGQRRLESIKLEKLRAIKAKAREITRAAKAPKAPKAPKEANGEARTARKTKLGVLVIKVLSKDNPCREGSKGAEHLEMMRGGITLADYLAKFPEDKRNNARQWVSNHVESGFVQLG